MAAQYPSSSTALAQSVGERQAAHDVARANL
jgi:hypothetical protein